METSVPSLMMALGAGLLSFFSPCILPLLPVYLSFLTGFSADELRESGTGTVVSKNLARILGQTLLFVLGFSVVFIALGASATLLSNFLFANRRLIGLIGGIIVIVLGLQVAGFFNLKFLQFEKKIHLDTKPAHAFGSFVIGFVFALGWTPCVGPILGSILAVAATKENVSEGIKLLSFYSLGLAIPFILTSIFVGLVFSFFVKIKKYFKVISLVSGLLLVFMGIALVTGLIRF